MSVSFPSRLTALFAPTAIAVALTVTIGACATRTAADTGPAGSGGADLAQRCATLAQMPTDPSAPLVTVVVDRTGSARELTLSPNLTAVLQHLQDTGAVLQTIGVNGTGIDPTVSDLVPLDPALGDSSVNADTIRHATLDCLPLWINTDATLPQGTNTDLLAALAAAVRQQPDEIVVVSDGVNTTSEVDLSVAPGDPVGTAEQIRSVSPTWTDPTTPVHWFHMAETDPPLSEPHRAAVTAFWHALLADTLTIDTRTGTTTGGN